jgi:hypothetical protein
MTGSVDLRAGSSQGQNPGSIINEVGGTFNMGPNVAGWNFVNNGVINPGGANNIVTTRFSSNAGLTGQTDGGFNQAPSGVLQIDITSLAAQKSDELILMSGTATVGGTIVPKALALLPSQTPMIVLTETGPDTLVSTAIAPSTLTANWNLLLSGNSLTIKPQMTFKPAGVTLPKDEAAIADYLQHAREHDDASLALVFGTLSQIPVSGGEAAHGRPRAS